MVVGTATVTEPVVNERDMDGDWDELEFSSLSVGVADGDC